MKSSHSGMPIFSLLAAVAPAELLDPLAGLELLLLLVTNPAHPFRKNTDTTRIIKMVFADIWLLRTFEVVSFESGKSIQDGTLAGCATRSDHPPANPGGTDLALNVNKNA